MKYAFYPGCSLHSTAREYEMSTLLVMEALRVDLQELPDWNCCGTTALPSTGALLALSLPARNLAIAREMGMPVAVACNSCFVSLSRTNRMLAEESTWKTRIEELLESVGRHLDGPWQVEHVLDILVDRVGLGAVKDAVKTPLEGLRVAPYYGCQIARPRREDTHPEMPVKMDKLLEAVGAEVVPFDRKTKCCGGALIQTKGDAVLELNEVILREAQDRGAQVVATTCPLCQMNLDLYQDAINKRFGTDYRLPVLFFTQLVGLALGYEAKQLGIGREWVSAGRLIQQYA